MPQPNSSPAPAAAGIDQRDEPCTASASSAIPQAATPAKYPSADTAIQMAVGATATKGAASRAVASSATARIAMMIAAAALEPTSTQNHAAHDPPPSPMRSSQTKVNSAPGG